MKTFRIIVLRNERCCHRTYWGTFQTYKLKAANLKNAKREARKQWIASGEDNDCTVHQID